MSDGNRGRARDEDEAPLVVRNVRARREPSSEVDFDFDVEKERLDNEGKGNVRAMLEAMDRGGLAAFQLVSATRQNGYERLHEQARIHQYTYESDHTFDVALELYNRQRCSQGVRPGTHVADEIWERKQVLRNHSKPCSECDVAFHSGMNYLQETSNGPWGAEKLCMGCMGRRLKKHVGTDLATIEAALVPLREAQREGIMSGHFAQTYCRRAPRPVLRLG